MCVYVHMSVCVHVSVCVHTHTQALPGAQGFPLDTIILALAKPLYKHKCGFFQFVLFEGDRKDSQVSAETRREAGRESESHQGEGKSGKAQTALRVRAVTQYPKSLISEGIGQ